MRPLFAPLKEAPAKSPCPQQQHDFQQHRKRWQEEDSQCGKETRRVDVAYLQPVTATRKRSGELKLLFVLESPLGCSAALLAWD